MSVPNYAYLSEQKLFLARGQAAKQVESQFVAQIHERRAAARERNQHRRTGMAWGSSQGFDLPDEVDFDLPPEFTAVTPGSSGSELYFSIVNQQVGGLFLLDAAANEERRLLHKQQLRLSDLDRHPESGQLLCSSRAPDGSAHIAVLDADGGSYQLITEGDVVDEAPRWVAGGNSFVYQTAGIGRDPNGMLFGFSPCAVLELDIDSGRLDTLLELHDFDCLSPCKDADGNLYYIRRPYELQKQASAWQVLGDIALFPYRVARAGVHFLNAFSWFFSKKPLLTAGGPEREGPDQRMVWLRGRMIEVRDLRKRQSDRPLVPNNWLLIRRDARGQEEVLAKHVAAFDLAADGSVLHTDGACIFHRTSDGASERVGQGTLIEALRCL